MGLYPNIFCVTITALLTCHLFLLNLLNLNRDSVRKAREAYLIERGQTLEPHGLNKKDELSTFLLHQLSMFRPFVLFIAVHYYFSSCNVFP